MLPFVLGGQQRSRESERHVVPSAFAVGCANWGISLIQQGVHIGEFHNLEELAHEKVYEFCYICATAKIKGTASGFALRPIAIK